MIKIYQLITSLQMGGAEIIAINLAEYCKIKSLQTIEFVIVEIYQTKGNYSDEKREELASKNIRIITLFKGFKRISLLFAPFSLAYLISKEKPSIIHSHTDLPDFVLSVCYKIISFFNIRKPKVVRTIHNTQLWRTHPKIGKFTEKGTIEIEAKQSGDFVIISVSDTGSGISNDKLCHVFNSFERLDTAIDKNYEGTGLGLFITKRLIELHGGEIWIRSEIGKGSSFSFNVPVTQEKAQNSLEVNKEILEIVDIKLKDLNEQVEVDCYTILAVDDDRTNLKALTNHLRFEGYTIKCV